MSFKLANFIELGDDQEPFYTIKSEIEKGIRFSGSNFWILIAAIFLASLGLNVNSTAVVIGAMLISPLMGPIIGMGLAASINDLPLIKRAALNYLFATLASLATSTIYFFFSPLDDAHSELLARTSPNIYDVFIALFGGFAGIIALSSKNKGNVLPGVAIATALMPPLCTAGYGIATGQPIFLLGAMYLYLINSVFIALATYAFTRFLKFPLEKQKNETEQKRVSRIIISLTLITLIPSIYFGYELIEKNRFDRNASLFIQREINDEKTFVLRRQINPSDKIIEIYTIGKAIDSTQKEKLFGKLSQYNLSEAELIINHGFSENTQVGTINTNKNLENLEFEIFRLNNQLDSLQKQKKLMQTIQHELPLLFSEIEDVYIRLSETKDTKVIVLTKEGKQLNAETGLGIQKWIESKLNTDSINIKILQ